MRIENTLSLNSSSTVKLNFANSLNYDRLVFNNDAIYVNGANLVAEFAYAPSVGTAFNIIDTNNSLGIRGLFAQGNQLIAQGPDVSITLQIQYNSTSANDSVVLVVTNVTPNSASRFKDRVITPEIFEGGVVSITGTIVDADKNEVFFLDVDWWDG
ncbi:MAG: hypothetical protein ACKPAD_06765, partial [Bacteroidota bacterium]